MDMTAGDSTIPSETKEIRPTAVHFGAGSIGRGFLGQLLVESGYEVVFVDVQPDLLARLNEERGYPLRLVSASGERTLRIAPVRAVDGRDTEAVSRVVRDAGILSTAVGERALPHIAPGLAEGLRWRERPVNLLICENLPDPSGTVRELLIRHGGSDLTSAIGRRIGLVPCIVSRMVPVPDPALLRHPLEVIAEPYAHLPIDGRGIVGDAPPVKGVEVVANLSAYVRMKLFIHNAGHAASAYHGYRRGCEFIHQAMNDPFVASEAAGVMREGAEAIHRADGIDQAQLSEMIDDLLERFRNPHLGDTVARVGRDPLRKLSPGERLIGSARLSESHGLVPHHTARAIAAALRFDPADDPSAARLQAWVKESGPLELLTRHCRLSPGDRLTRLVLDALENDSSFAPDR